MRAKVAAIVPSAGFGKRLGLKTKKPFVMLGGRPLAYYALRVLDSCRQVDSIIIACEKNCVGRFQRLVKRYRFGKIKAICIGGRTRFESVRNCLKLVDPSFDIVLVHDAARPFLDATTISGAISTARKFGACVVGVPEVDTVKLVGRDLFIKKTLSRSKIYRAQTPQVFKRALIQKAYALSRGTIVTDDAGLVENIGVRVKMMEGYYKNIKVTTKADLKIAEAMI